MVRLGIQDMAAWIYVGTFLLAAGISLFAIPSVIFVSKKKRLLDKPDSRKNHKNVTPNLGGIAIFSAFAFTMSVFNTGSILPSWNYIFAGIFLLFVTGLKDDLVFVDHYKKFGVQFLSALIVVFLADIRLNSLYGFLGIGSLPTVIGFFLSIVGIAFVTNAFNLIDGVDGLAGGIGAIIFSFYGIIFALNANYGYAIVCFSLVGAITGFLWYNIHPARIFMGDTGSLVLGFMAATLSVVFTETVRGNSANEFINSVFGHGNALSVALAAIIVPVYDTFRVFALRISKRTSPFHADRRHIHHVLLDCGMNPRRVSLLLYAVTLLFIYGATLMASMQLNNTLSILIIVAAATALVYAAIQARKVNMAQKERKRRKISESSKTKFKANDLTVEEYLDSILKKSPSETIVKDIDN